MRLPALAPSIALLVGVWAGVLSEIPGPGARLLLVGSALAVVAAHVLDRPTTLVAAVCVAFLSGGALLAGHARQRALAPSLRTVLDARFGGFAIDTLGPEGVHPPLPARSVLVEDAWPSAPGAQFRARLVEVQLDGEWVRAAGQVSVSVSGDVPTWAIAAWRAGRHIEAPITFRRPARYLNAGVPDHERMLALSGTTLFGSVKSALLVDVVGAGTWREERAADVRAAVRAVVERRVAPLDEVPAAIVSAILIGDRTGLPPEVRERLQAAGIYHVLAISGGNVAILVAGLLLLFRGTGLSPGWSLALTIAALVVYAQVVISGPSVVRAVVMALIYLLARMFDHRTPPWQAVGVAAALGAGYDPLDAIDAGFVLTFAATGALLGVVPLVASLASLSVPVRWLLAALAGSLATEVVLLPVGAGLFGRVTFVGVILNLAAIPLMTLVQVTGLALGLEIVSRTLAGWMGTLAYAGAWALVESSRLADVLPWLTGRVPSPPWWVVAIYYAGAAAAVLLTAWRRVAGAVVAVGAGCVIATGMPLAWPADAPSRLALTMFDVGQGEAMRLAWPGGGVMVVDSGGVPFGGGRFDVGDRVLRPALWGAGTRRIDSLLITHAHPDHLGGAPAVLQSFRPATLFEGIRVPGHEPFDAVLERAGALGARVRALAAGDAWKHGDVTLRVLAPERPDWERRQVRNDDSVVLEVRYGDVAVLLTGDIGADVERAIIPRLSHAPVRVLKVAHHGSRTSTSAALVSAWRPQIALISAGRGNRFGHPSPEVVTRLEEAGARVYRTDRDGAVTMTTDGRRVTVTTFVP